MERKKPTKKLNNHEPRTSDMRHRFLIPLSESSLSLAGTIFKTIIN